MPVDPDFGAVVDTRELESVGRETSRRSEYSAIPPVLLVQILRDVLQHVLANIQVGIHTILLQYLKNSRGHAMDRVPLTILIVGSRDGCTACLYVFRSGQFPVLRQLHLPWISHCAKRGQDEQAQRQRHCRNYTKHVVPPLG